MTAPHSALLLGIATALLLSACAPQTPAAKQAEVTRVVEVTRFPTPTVAAPPTPKPTLAAGEQAKHDTTLKYGDYTRKIRARGNLICGVSNLSPGFAHSVTSSNGLLEFKGLDADICRALAITMLGDVKKLFIVPIDDKNKLQKLHDGEVDVLIRNSIWTVQQTEDLDVDYIIVTYYDGQGIVSSKKSGINKVEDLANKTICVAEDTTFEWNLKDQLTPRGITYKTLKFPQSSHAWAAYEAGKCDAYTNTKSDIVAQMSRALDPTEHLLLDATLSKEPLGPMIRHGDDEWYDLVKWTWYALWAAEEYGITSKNIDEFVAKSKNKEIRRFLGLEGGVAKKLNTHPSWTVDIIKAVGNYGEIWDRHLGDNTPIKLPRGPNGLYLQGGLLYSPPFRAN